jgi:hypothetical protein
MAWPATQHWPSVASSTARTSSKLSPNITTFANAPPNLWTALTLMSGVFTGMTMVACTWVFVARTHACVVCVCVCVCVCVAGEYAVNAVDRVQRTRGLRVEHSSMLVRWSSVHAVHTHHTVHHHATRSALPTA